MRNFNIAAFSIAVFGFGFGTNSSPAQEYQNRKPEIVHAAEPAGSVPISYFAQARSVQPDAAMGLNPDSPAPALSSIFINNVCSPTVVKVTAVVN